MENVEMEHVELLKEGPLDVAPEPKKSFGQRVSDYSDVRSKAILMAFFSALALLLLLVGNFVTFSEPRASISEGFMGVELLIMLFTGNYVKHIRPSILEYEITVPGFVPVLVLVMLLVMLAVCLISFYFCFVRKQDIKWLGFAYFGLSALFFIVFCILVGSESLRAVNREGTELAFYQVFDTSILLIVSVLIFLVLGVIQLKLKIEQVKKVKKFWFSYLLLIVPTVAMLLFSFYPIFMQCIISFKDYSLAGGIWGSKWVGFQWFQQIFCDPAILRVIGNSFYLAILRIIANMLPSLLLAIFLYDMAAQKLRGVCQTILYIPHFFSWVVIYAVFYAFFANNGAVNQIIRLIVGDNEFYIDFLTNPNNIVPIIIGSGIWKEVGWGTILYLAALSNVDPTLFEAASIDGAGAMRKLWHITLPGIMSVVIFLLILSLGSVLANGLEQIMLFANTVVRDRVYTIELWVYYQGIGKTQYGISSAMGFFQSLIGLILVLFCNWLSRKTVDRGLW